MEKPLTPRQRAKREGKAYVKIVVDQRFSKKPGGALLEYDGPHTNEQAEEVLKFILSMVKKP